MGVINDVSSWEVVSEVTQEISNSPAAWITLEKRKTRKTHNNPKHLLP